jgi:AbrB family looped-hinge helix DNA binding protein
MKATIDPAGRLVIPKRIRDRLGLRGDEQVEITPDTSVLAMPPGQRC